jgi:hypothetical protein
MRCNHRKGQFNHLSIQQETALLWLARPCSIEVATITLVHSTALQHHTLAWTYWWASLYQMNHWYFKSVWGTCTDFSFTQPLLEDFHWQHRVLLKPSNSTWTPLAQLCSRLKPTDLKCSFYFNVHSSSMIWIRSIYSVQDSPKSSKPSWVHLWSFNVRVVTPYRNIEHLTLPEEDW